MEFSVRKDATAEELLTTLHDGCEAYNRLTQVGEQLKLVIGKTLAAIQERKTFTAYNGPDGHPYKTFERFLQGEIIDKYGIGRSTAFEALKVARALPQVSAEQYRETGSQRLLAIAAAKEKLPEDRQHEAEAMLAGAAKLTLEEVREQAAALVGGEAEPEVKNINFKLMPERATQWEQFLMRADLQAYVREHQVPVLIALMELAEQALAGRRPAQPAPVARRA